MRIVGVEIPENENGGGGESREDRLEARKNGVEEVFISWRRGCIKSNNNEVGRGEGLRGKFHADEWCGGTLKRRETIEGQGALNAHQNTLRNRIVKNGTLGKIIIGRKRLRRQRSLVENKYIRLARCRHERSLLPFGAKASCILKVD